MAGDYVDSVVALREQCEQRAQGVRTKYPRWIVTPDGDHGGEWCSDCGYYMVRNLRRHDRKRREDYILDGCLRTEEEHFCFCQGCGVRLDICLLEYGVREAVACFEQHGFTTAPAEDAFELAELLGTVDWRSADETADQSEMRDAIVALAERFLAENPTPTKGLSNA